MCLETKVATAFESAITPLSVLSAKKCKNSPSKNAFVNFFLIVNFFGDVLVRKTVDFWMSQKQIFHQNVLKVWLLHAGTFDLPQQQTDNSRSYSQYESWCRRWKEVLSIWNSLIKTVKGHLRKLSSVYRSYHLLL